MSQPEQTSLQLHFLDASQPLLHSSFSSLAKACREWGFFRITNHGITKEFYNRLCTLSNQAFNLPLDTKLKLGPSSLISSYTPHFIASPFFESLRVSGPNYYESAKSSSDVLFQPPDTEFCQIMQEYGKKMMDLSKKIMTVLLNCLGDGIESKYGEAEFSRCHGYLRINNYSPPESVSLEEVEGLGMHTDMSCITILYQDEVGGLQVRSREGEWLDIMPKEGTLIVNVGDLLQAWSNGCLRSSEHRVVFKKHLNRMSLAFFWCFEDEKVISAPEDLVGDGKQRIYAPFVCRDYVKFRENNEKGRFDKIGYTVYDFVVTKASESKEVIPTCSTWSRNLSKASGEKFGISDILWRAFNCLLIAKSNSVTLFRKTIYRLEDPSKQLSRCLAPLACMELLAPLAT